MVKIDKYSNLLDMNTIDQSFVHNINRISDLLLSVRRNAVFHQVMNHTIWPSVRFIWNGLSFFICTKVSSVLSVIQEHIINTVESFIIALWHVHFILSFNGNVSIKESNLFNWWCICELWILLNGWCIGELWNSHS